MTRARLLLLLLLAGCGADAADPSGGAGPAWTAPEPGPLRPVVRERLAALAPAAALPELPPADPEVADEVRGMVAARTTGDARFRDLVLEDVRALGEAAIVPLTALMLDERASADERATAVELLAVLDHPAAAERLMTAAKDAPETWLRSHCVWRLGQTSQDRVVMELLLRLKYERDPAPFVWIGTSLAHFRNLSGLDALLDLASREGDPNQATARDQLAALEQEHGHDAVTLRALWNSERARELPAPEASDALRHALWQYVALMGHETFALRPVDNARFALSRLGPWAADEVALALRDEDLFVRLHSSQVLAEMGGRARHVAPALHACLRDPDLAPAAAEALGRIGYPEAEPDLRAALDGPDHELRVAAARALGWMNLSASVPALQARFASAEGPGLSDLRIACARALVELGAGDPVVPYLLERLGGDVDPTEAEVPLERWLARGREEGRVGFEAAWEAWQAHADPPGSTPNTARAIERRRARAADLAPLVDGLLNP